LHYILILWLYHLFTDKVIDANDLLTTSDNGLSELLPPRQSDASTPGGVYNLDDILTEEEMKSLREGFEAKDSQQEEDFLKM